MIEFSGFALFVVVAGVVFIPRTTFLVTWFFNSAAVASVFGGSAVVLSVFGVLFFPKITMAYLLLEAVPGAPGSGEALYWIYLALALIFESVSKTAASHNRENKK